MVNKHIVRAIEDVACFLELSGKTVIDEDASVSALEQISYELAQLSTEEKEDFSRILPEISHTYGGRANFVRSLPEVLGIR